MKKTVLTTAEKIEILQQLQEVANKSKTLWALVFETFLINSHKKTDEEYIQVILTIQHQAQDNDKGMRVVLGETYPFFINYNIYEPLKVAV